MAPETNDYFFLAYNKKEVLSSQKYILSEWIKLCLMVMERQIHNS